MLWGKTIVWRNLREGLRGNRCSDRISSSPSQYHYSFGRLVMSKVNTIRESLYWSYSNLAMAHAAVSHRATTYTPVHFMIRSRLYKGLLTQKMNLGSIADDERLKMILPQACNYCGASTQKLSIDHLIPTALRGPDRAENFVWACRLCNSAKRDTDLLDWYNARSEFPPLLLLRRYLKVVIEVCDVLDVMDVPLKEAPTLPFSLSSIPHSFPKPDRLTLWCSSLDTPN